MNDHRQHRAHTIQGNQELTIIGNTGLYRVCPVLPMIVPS
jgi:hypothetical protein